MSDQTNARRAALSEPVIVGEFWANRGGESVRVQLRNFEGRTLIDVRRHFSKDGKLLPTKEGISITVARLPQLATAISRAMAKARELGLIANEASDD